MKLIEKCAKSICRVLFASLYVKMLTTKQDEAYDAALAEWKSAAKIKTWPDRIDK